MNDFSSSASADELYKKYGRTKEAIVAKAHNLIKENTSL